MPGKAYVYLSNMLQAWPIERQEALLAPHMDVEGVYRDVKLSAAARKNRSAAALKDRAALLKSPRQGQDDRLYVASLGCLIFDDGDLITVFAEAERGGLTIVALDTGREFPPAPGAAVLDEARDLVRASRQGSARLKGRERAAQVKVEDTKRRVELVRPHWHLREKTMTELRTLAGFNGRPMAHATLRAHLGDRAKAQTEHDREQAREAARSTKKETVK